SEQETINANLQILRQERENRQEPLRISTCNDVSALNPFYSLALIVQEIKKINTQELERRLADEFKNKIDGDSLLNAVVERVEIIQKATEHELDDFLSKNNVLDILNNEKINQMLDKSFGASAGNEVKHTQKETYDESDTHAY
ncbi:MAG: hypothetical protein RQ763_08605, partial [Sulfurimonas sp.]|uniref:hypothetical protein n=1 Tax=Sulfurimonas sp. TaxID=2022749 RepID=UPI0028CFA0E1